MVDDPRVADRAEVRTVLTAMPRHGERDRDEASDRQTDSHPHPG
jgi:hypothetical protein